MPTLANLVLNDGLTTPVARTFNVEQAGNQGLFTWVNRGTLIPVKYDRLTYANYRAKGSAVMRHNYKVVVPITDINTVGGIDRSIGQGLIDIKAWIPDFMTDAQRADLVAFAVNLLANTNVRTTLRNGESWF